MIERLKEEDRVEVGRLIGVFLTEKYPEEVFVMEDLLISLKEYMEDAQREVLVLKEKGKVIGFIGISFSASCFNRAETVAREEFLYISTDSRGAGAADKLLNTFEEVARGVGAKKIYLCTPVDSMFKVMNRYYRKKGFTLYESTFIKRI